MPLARYVATIARTVATDWNAFWYTPADPTLLGFLRICTGLMLVYTHAVWGLALDDFFGPTSWLSPDSGTTIETGQYMYSFWFWVPGPWMWPAYAASMLIFVLFTLGLWTRVTSVLALFTAISFTYRVPAALFGLDQINVMLTLYLAIGPERPGAVARSLAAPAPAGRERAFASSERERQPGPAFDSGSHVRDLSVRGALEAAGPVVVERRGDVAGVREPRVSVARHDLAGMAPMAGQRHDARFGDLGNLVLRLDLEAALAADRAGWCGRCSMWASGFAWGCGRSA